MSTLIDRLQKVSDRISTLPQKLGVPQYSQVVLEAPDGSFVVLKPQPTVHQLDSRKVGLELPGGGISGADDILVKDISRSYPLELISTSTFILDAIQDTNGKWQGKRTSVLNVDKNKLLTWEVLLKLYRDR